MKKSFLLTIFALLISTIIYSQVPQEFSYQSVIRDNTGKLVINQQVTVDIKIMSSTGTVYSENHSVVSSSNGLVSVDVGSKNATSFSSIDWGSSSHSMEVTITTAKGLTISTESKLLSVPYALFAGDVSTSAVGSQGPKGDKGDKGDKGSRKVLCPDIVTCPDNANANIKIRKL